MESKVLWHRMLQNCTIRIENKIKNIHRNTVCAVLGGPNARVFHVQFSVILLRTKARVQKILVHVFDWFLEEEFCVRVVPCNDLNNN